jgi:hypothetical protein
MVGMHQLLAMGADLGQPSSANKEEKSDVRLLHLHLLLLHSVNPTDGPCLLARSSTGQSTVYAS